MEFAVQQPAALQVRTMPLELIAHAAPATPAPFLSLMELGAEPALPRLAQTMPLNGLIVHATMTTLVPYLGVLRLGACRRGPTELGVELALRQLATLQIQTMLLELIAHATPDTLAPCL